MKFEILKERTKLDGADVLGLALYEDFAENDLSSLPSALSQLASRSMARENFKAKRGKVLAIPLSEGETLAVVVVGLGDREKATADDYRKAAFQIVRHAASRGASPVALAIPGAKCALRSRCIGEGAALAGYRFEKYHAKDEDDRFAIPEVVSVLEGHAEGLENGRAIALGQCYARDLANEPGNVINPETFEKIARDLASEKGFSCTVIQAPELKEKGMNALLSVGQGSVTPPRLIHLTYTPKGKPKCTMALVGKGITFDSGGLSLKPADSMVTMKGDKTGACVVLGAIKAAAELELPVKIHVVVGAAENMPGGGSYRPDDVIRAYNGKTIEVNNTDAEGRLTLADALVYACELKPDAVIDIATLTGACAVALGEDTAGLFTNDDEFADKFLDTAKRTGERFWKMPMDDDRLRDKLKSPIADMVNSAGRYGGAITAAMFLEKFVDEDTSWIHLDIAATDFAKDAYSYYTKGATGYGMRSIATFMLERTKEAKE